MRGIFGKASAALAAGLALIAAPVAAQDEDSSADDTAMMEALASAFTVEPLTAEQQARLPMARVLIDRVMPPGAMQDMMGGMFGGTLGPLMETEAADPASVVTERLGYGVSYAPEDTAEVAAILDPVWEERRRREMAAMPDMMARLMAGVEPVMRNVMAELYAIHFTADELAGIDAFFATPVGATYARKSFSMTADPRLTASMMQAMPAMMGSIGNIETELAAVTADLPPERSYDDLSAAERARLAELLGITEEHLSERFVYGDDGWAEGAAVEGYDFEDFGAGPTSPASGAVAASKTRR